ncbi:MAG: nicotinate-nucleotide adenylyltransferase [Candidatus Omnitrophica bacterium]|nr:nicotinate-nucleotide adenylyltransferase [Candidatus Omnitrophota bacterium]
MRIGILGGTFDPAHKGHIYLAKKACAKLRLDKIIFIPSYLPPHKKGVKVTPAKDRFNMLKLAMQDNKKFKISDMEIRRRGRSYSVETLRRLRKKYGKKAELFFITGSDSLKELNKWKNLKEILTLCRFVVVERPGFKTSKPPKGFIFLKISAKDISATDIRGRIKSDKPLNNFLPDSVKRYIYRYKLYGVLAGLLFILLGNGLIYAGQDNSPAGTIIKSQEMIEREKTLREKLDKNEKMHLKKAIVTGVTLIDKEKIKEIIDPFKNHWISKNDIQLILDSITAAYKEKGYADKLGRISYKIRKTTLNIIITETSQ